MKIQTLLWREIAHRKLNFAIGLLAVAVAAAGSVSMVTLLKSYQQHTAAELSRQSAELQQKNEASQAELQRRVEAFQAKQFQEFKRVHDAHKSNVENLDDEIRKITKDLGFNVFILPAEQNLADFYSADFAEKTMPEEYVHKLAANKNLFTIRHLRPGLIRKVEWTEKNRPLLLMGVSDVVPQSHLNPQKPLGDKVPEGTIYLGETLARELNLKNDDEVVIRGEKFRVGKVYAPQGNKDDVTAWINLKAIQRMLGMTGKINIIQALECNCATVDRLAEIQRDISAVLGDKVQVIEIATQAIARAKARNQVETQGQERLASIRAQGQADLERLRVEGTARITQARADDASKLALKRDNDTAMLARLKRLSAIVLPVMIVVACLMVGLLALINVRERRVEIGILRALGTRSRQIFTLFVARSALVGLIGAAAGYAVGIFAVAIWSSRAGSAMAGVGTTWFVPELLFGLLMVGPVLAVLAGWLPAMMAANEDPAVVLRDQ